MYSLYPENLLGSSMSWCGIGTKFWQEGFFPHMPFNQLIRGSEAAACDFITCNLLEEKVNTNISLLFWEQKQSGCCSW